MKELSRRGFLVGASALGGAAMAACVTGCSPQNETESGSMGSSEAATDQPAFLTPDDPIAEDKVSQTEEADVVVVGAGTSGLVSALSAAQSGLDVILISASSGPISRGGSNNAVYSRAMEAAGVSRVPYSAIQAEMLHGAYRPDQEKWNLYYNNSEEAMNWLIGIMEDEGYQTVLEDRAGFDFSSPFWQPVSSHGWCDPESPSAGGGQGFVVETLAKKIEEAGGTIHYSTIARQLVRGGSPNGQDGRVDAVLAELEDGSFAKYVGKKAVILATGDFSANGEMMKEYCGWAAPYFQDSPDVDYDVSITMGGLYRGDGHRMGLWVGAAWQDIVPCCCMGGNICVGPWRQLQENFCGLLVNENGHRYMNEAATSALGGMAAMLQPHHTAYALWNADYAEFHKGHWHEFGSAYGITPKRDPEAVVAEWDASVENGTYVRADTLEELVELLGLPASTVDTVERYNRFCSAGNDPDFHKESAFLAPLEKGPFYGAKKDTPDAMTVLGGLKTNADMQVCDKEGQPIDGLYNVGSMVGDFYSGIYTFQLQGVNLGACCLTFGYLTGKRIAQENC